MYRNVLSNIYLCLFRYVNIFDVQSHTNPEIEGSYHGVATPIVVGSLGPATLSSEGGVGTQLPHLTFTIMRATISRRETDDGAYTGWNAAIAHNFCTLCVRYFFSARYSAALLRLYLVHEQCTCPTLVTVKERKHSVLMDFVRSKSVMQFN